ncbi:MAG: hypothetical protein AAFA34_04655, partial [Thermoplasmata archaeon]
DRDPRRHTLTIAYRVGGRARTPRGGDDALEAAWVPLSRARGLAFDHARILADACRPPALRIRQGRSVA